MIKGTFVALVTPFDKNGNVNFSKIKELVDFHLQKGTDGLLPCGTTGESPTIDKDEKIKIFETVVEASNGRIPVLAGTGCYNTKKSIELTNEAKKYIKDFYLELRGEYNSEDAIVSILARNLDALVRLSEAHAKMALREKVLKEDVIEIIKLFKRYQEIRDMMKLQEKLIWIEFLLENQEVN